MYDLSIIIVSWNAKMYLKLCLQSIFNTTHNITFEVIVVDNNSTDGSSEMVKKDFPHVNLICTGANLGFAKANNKGIKDSKGRYIVLVNSDVKILNNCFESMYKYISRYPSIGILGPKVLNPDYTIQKSIKKFPALWSILCFALGLDKLFPRSKIFASANIMYISEHMVSKVEVLLGTFWMVRKEALDEVGFLDEKFFIYSEDIDWCKRFHEKGWEVVFYPDAKIIHYGGKSSLNDPVNFYAKMQKAKLQYWEKHYTILTYSAAFFILILHNTIRLTVWFLVYIILLSKNKKSLYNIKRYFAGTKSLLNNFLRK